jgi:hypothetical protein
MFLYYSFNARATLSRFLADELTQWVNIGGRLRKVGAGEGAVVKDGGKGKGDAALNFKMFCFCFTFVTQLVFIPFLTCNIFFQDDMPELETIPQ